MTRRPGDRTPEPRGGRAAERLREFLDQRYPEGLPPEGPPPEESCDEEGKSTGGAHRKKQKPKKGVGTARRKAPRTKKSE
jgi:hypothetical protein